MVTAIFRFYGELNDFLAPARRQRAFACPCAQAATAKHMIEALGVPHTEVDLVLVDGVPAALDRLLRDGERVAAYPPFAAFDIEPLARLRAPLPPVRRFVADAHLGGLARLLRMAGFDTLYDNNIDDDVLAAIAIGDERIALTRDRELLKRRGIVHGRYVHALRPAEQLVEIVDRFGLAQRAAPFTLCLHCNAPLRTLKRDMGTHFVGTSNVRFAMEQGLTPLGTMAHEYLQACQAVGPRPVDKALVLDQLPASVRAHHQEFSTCDRCHRLYWKGSHWKRMNALLAASLGAGGQGASR